MVNISFCSFFKHVIDDVIVPKFKGNEYYRGVEEGTDAIIKAVKGEYKVPANKRKNGTSGTRMIFIIIMGFNNE